MPASGTSTPSSVLSGIAEDTRTKLRILKSTFEEGLVDEDMYRRTAQELLARLVAA